MWAPSPSHQHHLCSGSCGLPWTKHDSDPIESLGINVHGCIGWPQSQRSALLAFLREAQSLAHVELLVSNGDFKQPPLPTRIFMFAVAIMAAIQANKGKVCVQVKVTLDLATLSFLDAADFLGVYALPVMTELSVQHLFLQKHSSLAPVTNFLQAIESLQSCHKCISVQLFDLDPEAEEPLTIHNLDINSIKLLERGTTICDQPATQLKLHIKKIQPGGLMALSKFLEESTTLRTLYLDMDDKIPTGSPTKSFHSILNAKQLLTNPGYSSMSHYVLPTTTVFLQSSDGLQLAVNPNLLAQKSAYFQVLFSGKFAQPNYIVELPECTGLVVESIVSFLRYGKDRRLPIPKQPWCSDKKQLQTMASLAHFARYFLIPGLLPTVYKLLRDTLKRYPKLSSLAWKVFQEEQAQGKYIPKVLQFLILQHLADDSSGEKKTDDESQSAKEVFYFGLLQQMLPC